MGPTATNGKSPRPAGADLTDLLSESGGDATLLAEIETLQLKARHAAQGALAGMHRSLRRGTSIEFSEHKRYTPGDDVRHIDWRAFAKTDRYHVKQFEDETNITLEILIDHSGSMAFASAGLPSKLDYARLLAAALGYLALRQGDSAGLLSFSQTITGELMSRATSTHLNEILAHLIRLRADGPTRAARAINHFAQRSRRRTVSVVLSDLFDPDTHLVDAFRRLAARRHDVAVLQVLDPAELSFPYDNPSQFVSLEDQRKLFVHPRTLRAAFVAEMKQFLSNTRRAMAEVGIDYHVVVTETSPANALGTFLRGRERR